MGLAEWLKVKALSSNLSTAEKKKICLHRLGDDENKEKVLPLHIPISWICDVCYKAK
jgi:hypothetical protein